MQDLVRELNRVYKDTRALWGLDFDSEGFYWLEANDADGNVVAFARQTRGGEDVMVCVCNLSPVARHGYRVGLPRGGRWREVLNTDDLRFGGSGVTNGGHVEPHSGCPWHDQPQPALVHLPPLRFVRRV